MAMTTATCWGFTINNPDENDKLLVRTPNEQFVKQIVVTPEQASTPHLQGWLKLHRQQRLSFVKKLFPRASFKPLTNDEYTLNARMYALKEDETTAGNHVITTNETMPDPINFLTRVIEDWVEFHWEVLTEKTEARLGQLTDLERTLYNHKECFKFMDQRERELIEEKPWLVKLVLSPMYAKAKKSYWREFLYNRIQHKDAHDYQGEESEELCDFQEDTGSIQESDSGSDGSQTDEGSDSGSESDSEQEDRD